MRTRENVDQNFLLHALPQMTWTNRPEGTFIFYNQKWYDYTGVNDEQMKAQGWNVVLHPDDLKETERRFTEALKNGTAFEIENRYRRFDGIYRWHLNRALPIKNEDGEIVLWIGTATDIEDKNHSETALSESRKKLEASEQRFKNLVTGASFPIAVYRGKNLVAEIANEAYLALVGKTEQEFIGNPLFDTLPEIESAVGSIIRGVMSTGVPFKAEEYGITMNKFGEDVFGYYSFIYEAVRDFNGVIDGFMATAIDITEQVTARKAIEESEAHLQLTRDAVPAMIFYLDIEQRYRSYNGVFMEWFQVDAAEAIGKTVREFLGEAAYYKAAPYLTLAYSGSKAHYEINAPSRMGSERWLSIVYTPHFNSEKKVVGIIVHATDITQTKQIETSLRESEALFRSLVEQASVATCLFTGKEMKIEIANDRMLAFWGKGRSVIGMPLREAVPELTGQPFFELLNNVFATGETFEGKAMPANLMIDNTLNTYYFDFSYKAIRNAKGDIYGIMDMAVDVTAQVETQKQIEAAVVSRTWELAESNSSLQRSNAELEQFAYVASHDLQEPIRKITVFLDLLERSIGETNDMSKTILDKLRISALRMSSLVRDVLTFSTISHNTPLFGKVDLNKVVAEVQSDFELQIEQRKATILYLDLPTLPAIYSQMLQLFSNLVSNSLKYTSPDISPYIMISSSELDEDEIKSRPQLNPLKKYHHIKFLDNGIGFNQDYAELIFKIFQRLHKKTEYEGTGIGLSLCLKIVQNHHGEISAESSPNNGALFHLILPAG